MRLLLSAAATALVLTGGASAQDVTLTMTELEFDDFFESCYPDWEATIAPEGAANELKFEARTVFAGTFGASGVRLCTETIGMDGTSSNSCYNETGDDDAACDRVEAITLSNFTCDGAPCASVTVTEDALLIVE